MKICVFGLGYVGCVSAACLASMGHTVVGIDSDSRKANDIRNGHSPVSEPDLDELVSQGVREGSLRISDKIEETIDDADVSMVCVGTPSRSNGSIDTQYLENVIGQIGGCLSRMDRYHVIAIRSTLLPGAVGSTLIPHLESACGKKAGREFGFCVNPEFLRESTAIVDFLSPPFTLIGEINEKSGDILSQIYADLSAPIYRIEPDAASMVKYASNSYHALKVTYANEIGAICSEMGIDSQKVMEIFARDETLNISAAYLRPGFAFGGSCLPKDLRALLYDSRHRDVDTPLMSAILPSNDLQIRRAVDLVVSTGEQRVALLGLSFKPGTDDLRESPLVRLAEALIGKGFDLRIYDEDVSIANLFGRNEAYIKQALPHISELISTDLYTVLDHAELLIIGKHQSKAELIRSRLSPSDTVIDLVPMGNWSPARETRLI